MAKNIELPYVIFEMANTHGGEINRLKELVDAFKKIPYPRKAIKFQAFKPNEIALPDFQWYKVYEELFFEPQTWAEVINEASEGGEIWLDIFDVYGVQVFSENKEKVAGIKLQASVLDNAELVAALRNADLYSKKMIINISGFDIAEIEQYVQKYSAIGSAELILQIGFQAYPTLVSDTALQKINILKAAFPGMKLCFADHAPGSEPFAQRIPVLAAQAGCELVEKHFCVNRNEAKYDHYSALEPAEMSMMLHNLENMVAASTGPFISPAEKNYLAKSLQIPVTANELPANSLVGTADLLYRRTDQTGLLWHEIRTLQSGFHTLNKNLRAGSAINRNDFVKARIGVIVACRNKSSRLKKKPMLPIHRIPAVERCLTNCLSIPHAELVVLSTSTIEEDAVLADYTLNGAVKFFRGDPEDVIKRYLGACDEFGIDVIIRVTADCPVVSPEIAAILLKSHFESGADYTAPRNFAVGSNSEIYNKEALQRVIDLLGNANHSEYMTWYMQNNPDVFKVNLVDLPDELSRNYRLTLDYPEDLEMFNHLYKELDENKLAPTLPNVFSVLDKNPAITAINQDLTLTYKTDQALIDKLNKVTRIQPRAGL